ncbi:hypothetical protein LIER_40985 [Lithospermum erythrorhizon]|uniref:Formin-like protein 18 n=1 Tax=Lithospermum erythrorhizon TaxID=34254 RepID=A0AAV3R405_LITER
MDPCPFVRICIANLAVKFPSLSKTQPLMDSCYCKIKLNKGYPPQFATIPLILQENDPIESKIYSCFTFKKSELDKFVEKVYSKGQNCNLKIEIFSGGKGCNKGGKLLGSVLVGLDLKGYVESGGNSRVVMQNGWVLVGKNGKLKKVESLGPKLHLNVKVESDPRFVFQFDGEPECSPQVFQLNGNVKQPVFTCEFSFRNTGERNLRSRSSLSEPGTSTGCLGSFKTDKEQPMRKERKGWSITVHDLSGSPVAAASMVTPFVPSQNTDRVSKSNPGAWLILRPGQGTWRPWGRLEAWRQGSSSSESLAYRFELIPDGSIDSVTLVNSSISVKNGGKINIDITSGASPLTSPNRSFDLSSGSGSGSGSDLGSAVGSGSWTHLLYRGFVMSSTVEGDGKCSKPEVEVGVQHVTCTEDAAVFVALAAAMDLSMDASRSFSKNIRKELRQPIYE